MSAEFIDKSKEELQLGTDKLSGLAHFLNTHNQANEAIVFTNGIGYISKVLSSLERIDPLLKIIKNGFTDEGPNIPYLTRELSKLPLLEEPLSDYTSNELGPKPWPDNPHYICDRGGEVLKDIGDTIVQEILYTARVCHTYHTGYRKEREYFSITDKYRDVAWDALFNLEENPPNWLETLHYSEILWQKANKIETSQFVYESQINTNYLTYGAGHIIYYLKCLSGGVNIKTSKHDKWLTRFNELYKEITKRYLYDYNLEVTPQDLIDIALKRRVVTDEGLIDFVPPRPDAS